MDLRLAEAIQNHLEISPRRAIKSCVYKQILGMNLHGVCDAPGEDALGR
jgi:hypothetical protein